MWTQMFGTNYFNNNSFAPLNSICLREYQSSNVGNLSSGKLITAVDVKCPGIPTVWAPSCCSYAPNGGGDVNRNASLYSSCEIHYLFRHYFSQTY